MDGVKDEVDTWGPVELLLSQNQGSAQLHTRIHPTIKDEVAETDSGSNCEYPEEGHTEEHLCIHRVEQPPGATVTSVCASCVQVALLMQKTLGTGTENQELNSGLDEYLTAA
uniref:Uncharacterized protein n=1 Tax=Knipowitschia caucasica TaxID=637954 RepID=A0AAV2LNT0_KNICA